MNPDDLSLRRVTYGLVPELGRVPTAAEVATSIGWPTDRVGVGWRRLHDAHALVLDLDLDPYEIRMANPFAGGPTGYWVWASGRPWFANCAWDAFGVCAAFHADGGIESTCPDCGERLSVEVRGEQASDRSLVFHCLVPAANWWDDIGFA